MALRQDAIYREIPERLCDVERILLGGTDIDVDKLSEKAKALFYERNWLFRRIVDLIVDTALKDGFDAAPSKTPKKPGEAAKPGEKTVTKTDAGPPVVVAAKAPPLASKTPGVPPSTPEMAAEAPDPKESDLYVEFLDGTFTDVFPDGLFHRACKLARIHGGAAILIGGASSPDQEFEPGEEVKWFDVATRHQLSVGDLEEDANSPRFGLPVTFNLRTHPRGPEEFHWTKVIILPGASRGAVPNDKQERPWTLSVMTPILAAVLRYFKCVNGVSLALDAFDVGVLTSPFLANALATFNQEEIDARQDAFEDGRKNARTLMLMADETYERPPMALGGVADTFDLIVQDVTAAVGAPRTLLFGDSPSGLTATGEGEDKNWRDLVKVYQTMITPALSRFVSALTQKEIKVKFAEQKDTPQPGAVPVPGKPGKPGAQPMPPALVER